MTAAQAIAEALERQEAIIREQRVPGRPVDALGRAVTECCGALDLGTSDEGGRPYQCLCQHQLALELDDR